MGHVEKTSVVKLEVARRIYLLCVSVASFCMHFALNGADYGL